MPCRAWRREEIPPVGGPLRILPAMPRSAQRRDAATRRCPAPKRQDDSREEWCPPICTHKCGSSAPTLAPTFDHSRRLCLYYIISAISPRKIRSLSQCLRPFDIDGTVLPNISIIRSFLRCQRHFDNWRSQSRQLSTGGCTRTCEDSCKAATLRLSLFCQPCCFLFPPLPPNSLAHLLSEVPSTTRAR